ncbi:oxidoreductase [Oryzomicrobium sp.]|uniref:oxidoreductase n=1 Tax=Oryzomicrobium sp. TaxID=1911578 RepID=UPI0025D1D96C|nr:oxidoreductase [Oryzomicrobium sp.]MCE1243982.1 oxidoreductase [Oryzomicrobium sp.]
MTTSFRIAVIGAGETGTPLLKQLLAAPFVQVLGVADLDLSLPGIALAREHGVTVTNNFMDLAGKGEEVDIIIDVTGAPKVRETLRQHMIDSGNSHTLILHERIALLMMSLSAGQAVSGKHTELEYH